VIKVVGKMNLRLVIKYYLTHGSSLVSLEHSNIITLILKSTKYKLIDGALMRKNYDNMFLRFLENMDADKVLDQSHDGLVGRHFGRETTAHTILRVGYYWPMLFRYEYPYSRKCKLFQTSTGKENKHAM